MLIIIRNLQMTGNNSNIDNIVMLLWPTSDENEKSCNIVTTEI